MDMASFALAAFRLQSGCDTDYTTYPYRQFNNILSLYFCNLSFKENKK